MPPRLVAAKLQRFGAAHANACDEYEARARRSIAEQRGNCSERLAAAVRALILDGSSVSSAAVAAALEQSSSSSSSSSSESEDGANDDLDDFVLQ